MPRTLRGVSFIFLLTLFSLRGFSQLTFDRDTTEIPRKKRGFQAGFFMGTYFANRYNAQFYDGYGLDANGKKNDFVHSAMYQQIIVYNGGYNGQADRIAQALNVQHGEWSFAESDMPINLKYNIAFMAGVNLRYQVGPQGGIILNANTCKLNVNGDFTIVTQTLNNGNTQPQQIKTFSIAGTEQRLLLQLGYQHLFDEEAKVSIFYEYGLNMTMAKFVRNQANINGLLLDLTYNYSYPNIGGQHSKYLTGVALGGYLSLGLNFNLGSKWLMQMLYLPSFEKVNIGPDPKYKLNHAFGVRGYYTF